jgi:hypothetical protein
MKTFFFNFDEWGSKKVPEKLFFGQNFLGGIFTNVKCAFL